MSSQNSSNTYQTYLLRLRRHTATDENQIRDRRDSHRLEDAISETENPTGWQLILVHPYTGAKRTFESIEALTIFLQEQMKDG